MESRGSSLPLLSRNPLPVVAVYASATLPDYFSDFHFAARVTRMKKKPSRPQI